VDTHHHQPLVEEIAEMRLEGPSEPAQADEEDEVALDMEEFEASGLLDAQDDTTLRTIPQKNQESTGGEIKHTR